MLGMLNLFEENILLPFDFTRIHKEVTMPRYTLLLTLLLVTVMVVSRARCTRNSG